MNSHLQKFLIYKIHLEQNFIKNLYLVEIFWSNKKSFASNEIIKEEEGISVLERIEKQLIRAGLKNINFTKKPDLSWAVKNVKNIINRSFEEIIF